MSSSNLVSVVYDRETEYGKTDDPLSGVTLNTARFINESLSGTPVTAESGELRIDRMSAGQAITGLDVGGALNFELSRDVFFDDWFESALMSSWVAANEVTSDVTLVPDPADDQKATLTLATALTGAAVGDLLQLRPNGGSETKVVVSVISVDTPDTVFTVATPRGTAELTTVSMFVSVPAYVDIGAEILSFTVGKAYEDVVHEATTDEHSQTYTGVLVSGFSINAEYGSFITGSFETLGNGYYQESPSLQQRVVTAGGTVVPAGTNNVINASIDVPLVIAQGEATDFCIESFTLQLDNGLTPQNCIGKIAPTKYSPGTANITISTTIYLSDTSYDTFMPAKLTQAPIGLTYVAENLDGGYAFSLPAVQLSFPDPAATGPEQTMIDASGVAKVGSDGSSALRVYKLEA